MALDASPMRRSPYTALSTTRQEEAAASHPATEGCARVSYRQHVFSCCLLSGPGEEVDLEKELRVNERIRADQVRLVAPDGSQVGVKKREEALWLADQLGLDLVEVAPEADPPVCRIMDYGKWKYERSVAERGARKKQARTVIKEIKFRPKISDHDFGVKRQRVEEFLQDGDKVKVTVMFRGREVTHPELGARLLERLADEVKEIGKVETEAKLEGRNMTMVLSRR